ncbi:MAG: hypothetical protein ACI861_001718 [Paracoccaceae bacterium]
MQDLRDQLRAISRAEMAVDAAHDIAHLDRVWINVQRIVAGEDTGDLRLLLAAAYLHDLVNIPKNSPDRARASTLAAEQATPFLAQLGFDELDRAKVQHIIAAHSYSGGIAPLTIEAKILRDADRLDAIGAIGVARTFAVAGLNGQTLYDNDDPFAQRRALNDRQFSLDHWRVKLLGLADGLQTETAQNIAADRLDFMHGFLKQISSEINVELPKAWRK